MIKLNEMKKKIKTLATLILKIIVICIILTICIL